MKINLRMRTMLLLILMPTLLVVTILMAWIIYSDLYQTILSGFDKKLYAVSTVTSSFIDGDDHAEIAKVRQIRGLAYDPVSKVIYGSYVIQDQIAKLNVETGDLDEIGPVGFEALGDLTYDPKSGTLYCIGEVDGKLIKIDTQSGKGELVGSIGSESYGLAFDVKNNVIYSNNENLIKLDPVNGESKSIGPIGFPAVRGLAFDQNTNTLYGVNTRDNQLIKIDTQTGAGKAVDFLHWAEQPQGLLSTTLELGNFGLTFDTDKNVLYGSTTIPLIEIEPLTAKSQIFSPEISLRNGRELYLDYVHPMIDTMRKSDLTYLFTCVLKDRGKVMSYVMDSTQDEIHSFVGYDDPDEPEEKLKDVWLKGKVYLSDISYWEEWGLLKSGYSPIFSDQNKIKGIAGTDVNISVIEKKTRMALLKVCLIGLSSLMVGILVSVYITRKLTEPIGQLKDIALRVAAGQYGTQIKIDEPLEMKNLSIAFNEMSRSLKETISQLTSSNQELENRKRRQELMRVLAREIDEKKYGDPKLLAHDYFFAKESSYSADGWISTGDKFIMWLADSPEDPLQSVKIKHDIYKLFAQLYDNSEDWTEFRNRIEHLFRDNLYCLCLFDPKNGVVKTFARRPVKCVILNRSGSASKDADSSIELNETDLIKLDNIRIKRGQAIVISSLDLTDLLMDAVDQASRLMPDELDASNLLTVLTELVKNSSISQDAKNAGIVSVMTL